MINKNIFRGYDIRGVYPTDLNEEAAELIGAGFASMMKRKGETQIIVGRDVRLSSDSLFNALTKGIISTLFNNSAANFRFSSGTSTLPLGLCEENTKLLKSIFKLKYKSANFINPKLIPESLAAGQTVISYPLEINLSLATVLKAHPPE